MGPTLVWPPSSQRWSLGISWTSQSHFLCSYFLCSAPHMWCGGFPGDSDSKEFTSNAGDLGLILKLGRSSGEGHGYPLQYSYLENSMNRGAWRAIVHGITESDLTEQLSMHMWCTLRSARSSSGGSQSCEDWYQVTIV